MRISEWSSDVCSSDLQRRAHATIIATAVSNPFLWMSRYNCTQKLGSVIGGGTGLGQSDTNTKLSRRIALISRPRSGGEIRSLRPVRMSSTWKPASANSWRHSLWERKRTPMPKVLARSGGSTRDPRRSEEHTSELQSLMRNSYAVFCLKKKTTHHKQ